MVTSWRSIAKAGTFSARSPNSLSHPKGIDPRSTPSVANCGGKVVSCQAIEDHGDQSSSFRDPLYHGRVEFLSDPRLVDAAERENNDHGGRSTDPADFPEHKTAYALRDVAALQRQAARHGEATGRFATRPSRWRARIILRVVIEPGLCRSGRTRRTAGPEVRWRFGDW